jgi:hypothetical protein
LIKAYNDERRRLAREAGDQMSKLTRRNAEVPRELERLIDAVTQGVDLATLVPRIKALEIERASCNAPTRPISSHCIPLRSSNTAPMSKDWPRLPPSTATSSNRLN